MIKLRREKGIAREISCIRVIQKNAGGDFDPGPGHMWDDSQSRVVIQ